MLLIGSYTVEVLCFKSIQLLSIVLKKWNEKIYIWSWKQMLFFQQGHSIYHSNWPTNLNQNTLWVSWTEKVLLTAVSHVTTANGLQNLHIPPHFPFILYFFLNLRSCYCSHFRVIMNFSRYLIFTPRPQSGEACFEVLKCTFSVSQISLKMIMR